MQASRLFRKRKKKPRAISEHLNPLTLCTGVIKQGKLYLLSQAQAAEDAALAMLTSQPKPPASHQIISDNQVGNATPEFCILLLLEMLRSRGQTA